MPSSEQQLKSWFISEAKLQITETRPQEHIACVLKVGQPGKQQLKEGRHLEDRQTVRRRGKDRTLRAKRHQTDNAAADTGTSRDINESRTFLSINIIYYLECTLQGSPFVCENVLLLLMYDSSVLWQTPTNPKYV